MVAASGVPSHSAQEVAWAHVLITFVGGCLTSVPVCTVFQSSSFLFRSHDNSRPAPSPSAMHAVVVMQTHLLDLDSTASWEVSFPLVVAKNYQIFSIVRNFDTASHHFGASVVSLNSYMMCISDQRFPCTTSHSMTCFGELKTGSRLPHLIMASSIEKLAFPIGFLEARSQVGVSATAAGRICCSCR